MSLYSYYPWLLIPYLFKSNTSVYLSIWQHTILRVICGDEDTTTSSVWRGIGRRSMMIWDLSLPFCLSSVILHLFSFVWSLPYTKGSLDHHSRDQKKNEVYNDWTLTSSTVGSLCLPTVGSFGLSFGREIGLLSFPYRFFCRWWDEVGLWFLSLILGLGWVRSFPVHLSNLKGGVVRWCSTGVTRVLVRHSLFRLLPSSTIHGRSTITKIRGRSTIIKK